MNSGGHTYKAQGGDDVGHVTILGMGHCWERHRSRGGKCRLPLGEWPVHPSEEQSDGPNASIPGLTVYSHNRK